MRRFSYFSAPGVFQKDIIDVVCEYFCIERNLLLSKNRKREVSEARQIGMYILRQQNKTLSSVGKQFNRDHATVLHAINLVEDLMSVDARFKQIVESLESLYRLQCQIN
ncbi:MAG: helix-turn-helix domain-containing protein [Bacteroidota bacterium]